MHKSSLLILLIISIFTLTAGAENNPAGNSVEQTLVKPDPQPPEKTSSSATVPASPMTTDLSAGNKVIVVPTPADDAKAQTTLTSLAAQAGWFPELKISVKNGIVIIKGKTKDAQHLEWLAKTADRLPAVIAVINQAQIETPPVSDLTPAWNEFKRLIEKSKKALPRVMMALILGGIFFFVGGRLLQGMYALWSRRIKNLFLLSTVARLSMLPVWLLFFYLTLQVAGLSSLATTIIGGTGALGIVLGFAFKDIAENYLSGILLAIRAPFTKGDEIQVAEHSGFVQSLNMRGTTILDYDGSLVLIPNSMVIQSIIRNRSVSTKSRGSFTMAIGYEDSITQAQALIKEVVLKVPGVLPTPEPVIFVEKLTSSMVSLKTQYWFDSKKTFTDRVNSMALSQAKEALLSQGFALPHPNQEIILGDEIKVRVLEGGALDSQRQQATAHEKAKQRLQESQEAPCPHETTDDRIRKISNGSSDLLDRSHHPRAAGEVSPAHSAEI